MLRIINEPTAASLAYGLDKKSNETILVFDLGGGTFDVSVLEVGDGVFEVLSTSGDTHLGGDDFDKRIVDWLAEDFKKSEGLDLRSDRQALQVRRRDGAPGALVAMQRVLGYPARAAACCRLTPRHMPHWPAPAHPHLDPSPPPRSA